MNRGQIIKMILIGTVGALVGFFTSIFAEFLPSATPLLDAMIENIIYFMLIPSVFGMWALVAFINIKNKLKAEDYSNEEGSLYESKQHILQMTMSAGTLTHILNFMFFGINLYYIVEVDEISTGKGIILTVLWTINSLIAIYLEVANINLIKKVEPEKNADPTSFKYNSEAIDTLDERELIIAGRASLKTDAIMPIIYALFFLVGVTMLSSPIYFVGLLAPWGTNVAVKTIYLIKEKKGK